MSLRRFRRQFEQLLQFERERIIGMMEAGCRREDRHIVRNACVQPTASWAAIQTQVAPSLGTSVSSRTIQRRLSYRHLGSRCPLHVLSLTPTHRRFRLEWFLAQGKWTAAKWNQVVFSDESRFNLSSDDNRVRVWRSRGERLNPAFSLQRHSWCDRMGCHCLQYTVTPCIDPWHHDNPVVCT
ncbi:transposable element Tcb2 transposase [Trichonephila clavipes]|nr:transposable element Tcb2 transposase [Trichonephila clavipes]